MNRLDIFKKIEDERAYQDNKWGAEFDEKNTVNDWLAYIARYIGKAESASYPYNNEEFRKMILKVATLAVAALEQESYAPRHYDKQGRLQ